MISSNSAILVHFLDNSLVGAIIPNASSIKSQRETVISSGQNIKSRRETVISSISYFRKYKR